MAGRLYLRVHVYPPIGNVIPERRYIVWQNVYQVKDGTQYLGDERCELLERLSAEERAIAETLPVKIHERDTTPIRLRLE